MYCMFPRSAKVSFWGLSGRCQSRFEEGFGRGVTKCWQWQARNRLNGAIAHLHNAPLLLSLSLHIPNDAPTHGEIQ